MSKSLALGLGLIVAALTGTAEENVRFSLRVLDNVGKEVRWVVPGTNRVAYTLEGYAENVSVMNKPAVALAWTMTRPEECTLLKIFNHLLTMGLRTTFIRMK